MNNILKLEYNTSYKCLYYDKFLETTMKEYDEELKILYISDLLYREDLLNIFNLKENDDFEKINNILDELFIIMKEYEEFNNCIKKCAKLLLSDDEQLGFRILYSFDFMHITHICISEYLTTNKISNENICLLKSKLY